MLTAIGFYDQHIFDTREVYNERTNGMLTAEFGSSDLAVAEEVPEAGFGLRAMLA